MVAGWVGRWVGQWICEILTLAVETNTIESSVVSWIGIALQWHRF